MEIDDDVSNNVLSTFVIKCTDVPVEFFKDRNIAKRYFRRFGKVKLVMFKPKVVTCFVEYFNEESMKNALEIAGEFNGHIFNVCRDVNAVLRKKKMKKEPDPDWISDPEVLSEMEAMSGVGIAKKYNLRAEAMAVDPIVEPKQDSLPKLKRNWKSCLIKNKRKSDLHKSPQQLELINIVKSQAFTIEDKYRILDARDKLIRLKLKKCVDLLKTGPTIGICPDMCPEKERLMRETQHQVSIYEQDEGVGNKGIMNPKLAIKQYSRSSADQEAPLPQDLRPVYVLKMTMCYLIHKIMNLLCDDDDDDDKGMNISEWYHFLWDRTRGIRKDITQQELCCQGSVELVEQCARFHIVCSARLVNEDPSVFDQKINTENLTKCLQTLKYMYHDLDLKNEKCVNEAEFRAYVILLNLNDGNFMWEVQQLRPEIQHSKQVGFALDVYSALDKNNYVKFFKLVKSTTLLNACILMRYFVQVRMSALKTLIKCYSPRNQQSLIPIVDLMDILAFENYDSTVEFLQYYGLMTNSEGTHIVLDKTNQQPDYHFVLDRAINLVESKRYQQSSSSSTIGQIVYGNQQLPDKIYENHLPQNSFDSNGFLMLQLYFDDSDFAVTHDTSLMVKPIEEQPPLKLEKPTSLQVSESQTTAEKQPFLESQKSEKSFLQVPPSQNQKSSFDAAKLPISTNVSPLPVMKLTMSELIRFEPSKFVVDQLAAAAAAAPPPPPPQRTKTEEDLVKKHQEALWKQLEEKHLQKELEKKVLLDEMEQERKLEEKRRKQQKRIEDERKMEHDLKLLDIENNVKMLLTHLVNQVEIDLRQEKLNEICHKIRNRKLHQFVIRWCENIKRNKRKRKSMDYSPFMFSTRTINEECKELETTSQFLTLSNRKRYKHGFPLDIIQQQPVQIVASINLLDKTFDLLTKRYLELNRQLPTDIYWKLTISLPNRQSECRNNGSSQIEQILNNYLQWTKHQEQTICLLKQYKPSSTQTITYCIERQKGLVKTQKTDSNGFIFIANDLNDDLLTRIVANLKNFGVFVKIPIVLILQNYNENKSKLKLLIDEGIVSNYIIIVDDFSHLPTILDEAIMFLANNKEKLPPPLEMDTFENFLKKLLLGEIWRRANSFAKWNTNYKNCLKHPNICIRLYNEALVRLRKMILNPALMEYAKFPDIFRCFLSSKPDFLPCDYRFFPQFWSNPTYLNRIESILNQLELPLIETWPPPPPAADPQTVIQDYCARVFENSLHVAYKMLGILLQNVENVLWTDLVETMAGEKIKEMEFTPPSKEFASVFNQLIVVYDCNSLKKDYLTDWFYLNNPIIKERIVEMLKDDNQHQSAAAAAAAAAAGNEGDEKIQINIVELWSKLENEPKRDFTNLTKELEECKTFLNDLENAVDIEKKIFHCSGNFLASVVEEN